MSLHPDTVGRIREFFGAHRCCHCGGAAARFREGRFYCAAHFRPQRAGGHGSSEARRPAGGR